MTRVGQGRQAFRFLKRGGERAVLDEQFVCHLHRSPSSHATSQRDPRYHTRGLIAPRGFLDRYYGVVKTKEKSWRGLPFREGL